MSRRQHISRYVFHIGKWTIFIGRWVVFANVAFLFILAMSLVAVRLWLPTLVDRKDDIEEFLSRKTDYHFKIEKISTYWDGIYPGIIMQGLSITDKEQQKEELSLQEVRAGIALRPLFRGSLQLGRLSILNPQLALERTSEGTLYLRGLKKGVTPGEKRASVNAYKVLSRLNEVIIENGTLEWNDANDPDGRLVISNVNVVLETSARRYKLNIRAKLPNEMCVSCYVDMEFDPTKLVEKKWSGEVYVHSVGLSPHNLPLIVRERLPENFSGTFDTLLRAEIRDNTPRKIKGYVSLSGLNLQLPGQKKITVDSARGQVDWEYEGNSWSLDTNELEMTLQGQSWNPDKVTVSLGPESSSLQVKQLDLEIAARMLRGVPFEHLLKDKILEINPKGKLSDISLTLQGPLYQPADFSASAVLSDLSLEPIGKIPGVEGLSGKIALTRYSGEFDIDSHAVKVTVPGIFRWPLQARRVLGSVSWHKTDNAWNVDSDKLDLHSDDVDGELNFHFILPHDRAESPYLDLDAVVKNASLQHISRYYPVNKVRPKLLSWLDNGIRGGRVTSGHVVVKGKTREFPFVENNGSFEAVAHIEDGYLDYLPGFPPLTRADILLNFFANKMLITCREGELGGQDVSRLTVSSNNLKEKTGVVIDISGQLFGPVDSMLSNLRLSRFGDREPVWVRYINPDIHAQGTGTTALSLVLNTKEPKETQVKGKYQVHNALMVFPIVNLQANTVSGDFIFDNLGIAEGAVSGNFLGGESHIQISRQLLEEGGKETRANMKGTYTAEGLAQAFGSWMEPYLFGYGDWTATMFFNEAGQDLRLLANTEKLELRLPQPMEKPVGTNKPLIAETALSTSEQHIVNIRLTDLATAVMKFNQQSGRWSLWGTHLAVADAVAQAPDMPGLKISAKSSLLDGDLWQSALSQGEDGDGSIPDFITGLEGDFTRLDYLDRQLGPTVISMTRKEKHWRGHIGGSDIIGKFRAFFGLPYHKFEMDLEKLAIPSEPFRDSKGEFDSTHIPRLHIKANAFHYGKMQLGQLDVMGAPEPGGWQLQQMILKRPDTDIYMAGTMATTSAGTDAEFKVTLDSRDIGETLRAFDLPRNITAGSARVETTLKWDRASSLGIDNVRASQVSIKAEKGQFAKIEQGAGRLLGIFDPTALARYLTLDFKPIFGKGFSFNEMKGNVKIDKGDAYTHDLVIKGPTADVSVSGRIGYIEEDYDLIVGVNPSLTDKLAIASWGLGVPQIGAAVLLVKGLFRKQTKKAEQLTYTVKGTWDNPIMARVGGKVTSQPDETKEIIEGD